MIRAVFAPPKWSAVLAALNAAVGDRLEREGSTLALPMAIRLAGADIGVDRRALSRAFGDAAPRLVGFVHGLGETEAAWSLGGKPGYGERLHRDLGYPPMARSACHYGQLAGSEWVRHVGHVVCMGSPHLWRAAGEGGQCGQLEP